MYEKWDACRLLNIDILILTLSDDYQQGRNELEGAIVTKKVICWVAYVRKT